MKAYEQMRLEASVMKRGGQCINFESIGEPDDTRAMRDARAVMKQLGKKITAEAMDLFAAADRIELVTLRDGVELRDGSAR